MIHDASGLLHEGDIITICTLETYELSFPPLSKGMKFVMATSRNEDQDGRYWYAAPPWMYYVTDDGYVLSGFKELPELTFSGKKADRFLESLTTLKADADARIDAAQELAG